jgi:hypothetical protein
MGVATIDQEHSTGRHFIYIQGMEGRVLPYLNLSRSRNNDFHEAS